MAYRLGRCGSEFGGLLMLMTTALLGDCRMHAAVLLVAQACKSGVAYLLASQSPVIDPDKEEAAAKP